MLFGEKVFPARREAHGSLHRTGEDAGTDPHQSPWELGTGPTGSNPSLIEFIPILLNELGLEAQRWAVCEGEPWEEPSAKAALMGSITPPQHPSSGTRRCPRDPTGSIPSHLEWEAQFPWLGRGGSSGRVRDNADDAQTQK